MLDFYREVSLQNGSFKDYVFDVCNEVYNSAHIEGNTVTYNYSQVLH